MQRLVCRGFSPFGLTVADLWALRTSSTGTCVSHSEGQARGCFATRGTTAGHTVLRIQDNAPSMDTPAGQIRDSIIDLIKGITLGHQRVQVELAPFIPPDKDGEIAVRTTQAAAGPGVGALSGAVVTISPSPWWRKVLPQLDGRSRVRNPRPAHRQLGFIALLLLSRFEHPPELAGTVSYYDCHGERLCTRRMARMPEPNKATLKSQLTAEVMGALSQRPDLRVIKVADGAPDNWSYLGEMLPFGEEVLDFYHVAEHLGAALGAAYGEGTPTYQERVETLSEVLRDAPEGVETVMGALCRLRTRYPRRKAIHKALAYFREHRHRMRYASLRAQHLPIGSGVVEAACKTLVSQRLKRSGMRWRTAGGQAILTLRALCQSERFERAWSLLGETYKRSVTLPRNVIAFKRR